MSELKTNKIATNDTNNVSIDDALNLKSYTTTQMNALTAVAGDVIYNSTSNGPYYYNGSAWVPMQPWTATGGTTSTSGSNTIHTFTSSGSFVVTGGGTKDVTAYVIGGGGAGGTQDSSGGESGGGGGGGMATKTFTLSAGTYSVTVGAGGAITSSGTGGTGCLLYTSDAADE